MAFKLNETTKTNLKHIMLYISNHCNSFTNMYLNVAFSKCTLTVSYMIVKSLLSTGFFNIIFIPKRFVVVSALHCF